MDGQGMVYLVGAGPGNPGLVTVRGRELLECCDAVVYDHLASGRLLDWTPAGCRKIYVGKQAGRHSMSQEEISRVLVKLALSGLMVVRLKGGDPFVFGRGGEEALALMEHGISFELVPGVTSAVAAPESVGIPVTHRAVSRVFHVMTGHTRDGEDGIPPGLEAYGKLDGTLVFLMGLSHLPDIAASLIRGGMSPDMPAAVIEKGTLPGERAVRAPLGELEARVKAAGLKPPAIIVVGQVTGYEMRDRRLKTLSGIRVGITGTRHFAGKLASALEAKGAEVSWLLEMEVRSHAEGGPMQAAYAGLAGYGWTVLTSVNGVRLFFQGLFAGGRDVRALGHMKFAVIGEGTRQELMKHGIRADYMPECFCAEDLAKGLAGILPPGSRVLVPRSKGGSPELTDILERAGITVDDIALYETAGRWAGETQTEEGGGEDFFKAASSGRFHYLAFASASGVRAFFESPEGRFSDGFKGTRLACIGHITALALRKAGFRADVVAGDYQVSGLIQALEQDILA